MIRLPLFPGLSLLALLSAAALSAQVSTNTVMLSVTPTQTLTDLYFLYAQGDISRAFPLMGDAPANKATFFDISAIGADLPFPVPGTPYFSLVGVYDTTAGNVAVAIDPSEAPTLVSSGIGFDDAFYSFSEGGTGTPFGESNLATAMENPTDYVDGFPGSELVQIFADTPEQQIFPLFTPYNASGITAASLVDFSDATSGGTVSLSIEPSGVSTATPEPAAGWLLGAVVLAFRGWRSSKK